MGNLKRKFDWIDEWQHQSHVKQDILITEVPQVVTPDTEHSPPPLKLGLVKQEVATLPPPDFLISKPLQSKTSQDEKELFQNEPLNKTAKGKEKQKKEKPVNFFKRLLHWCYEELSFTMSKISIFGLVMGLMLLGALLFVGGFLIAFSQYFPHPPAPQSAWATANNQVQQGGYSRGQEGQPGQPQGAHEAPHRRNIAASIADNEVRSRTSRVTSHLNLQRFSSHVPAPLAPFANYGNSAISSNVQGTVRGATNQITAPLHGGQRTNMAPPQQSGPMQNDRGQPFQQQQPYDQQQVQAGQNIQQYPMNQAINQPMTDPQVIYQTPQANIHAPYTQQNLQQQPRQYARTPSYRMQQNYGKDHAQTLPPGFVAQQQPYTPRVQPFSDRNMRTYPNTAPYAPVEQGRTQHPSWSSIQDGPTYRQQPQPSFPTAPQSTPHSVTEKNAWTQQNQQYTERQG